MDSAWERRKNYGKKINLRLKPNSNQIEVPKAVQNGKRKRSNSFTISLDKTLDNIDRPEIVQVDQNKKLKKDRTLTTKRKATASASTLISDVKKMKASNTVAATSKIGNKPLVVLKPHTNNNFVPDRRLTIQAVKSKAKKQVQTPQRSENKPLKRLITPLQKNGTQGAIRKYHVPAKVDTGLRNRMMSRVRVSPRVKVPSKCKPSLQVTGPIDPGTSAKSKVITATPAKPVRRNSFSIPQDDKRNSTSFFVPNDSLLKTTGTPAPVLRSLKSVKSRAQTPKSQRFNTPVNSQKKVTTVTPASILRKSKKKTSIGQLSQGVEEVDSDGTVFVDCLENVPQTPGSDTRKLPRTLTKTVSFQVPHSERSRKIVRKTPKKEPSLRVKLEDWLDNHNTSNLRHVNCFGFNTSDLKLRSSSVGSKLGASPMLQRTPKRAITECDTSNLESEVIKPITDTLELIKSWKTQLENGKDPNEILSLLGEIEKTNPEVLDMFVFWELSTLVAQMLGSRDQALASLCRGLSFQVQPVGDFEILVRKYIEQPAVPDLSREDVENEQEEIASENKSPKKSNKPKKQRDPMLSTPLRDDTNNKFESAVLKFALARNDGSVRKLVKSLDLDSDTFEAVLTPVRRSARLSKSEKKSFIELKDLNKERRSHVIVVPNPNF